MGVIKNMIDAHCHLQDLSDIDTEVQRGKGAGVDGFICNGYDLESSRKAITIAEKYDVVYATAGIHPEHSSSTSLSSRLEEQLLQLARHPKVVAIGESGLDNPNPAQIALFEWHIQLAKKTGLPLVVHCRNAFGEIYERLRMGMDPGVQMHCWTGDWDWTKKFLDLGCYLSFGGIVTFKSSHELREVVKKVPADRLVLETDAPYLSPSLAQVTKVVAKVRGLSLAELDHMTTANVYSLFPKLKLASR